MLDFKSSMVQFRSKVRQALLRLLEDMNAQELRETADFVLFLKTRSRIDPGQAYFWTAKWQAMERQAQADKRKGRILGAGNIESLLRALKA
ncbi:MAG: hypothetical protein HYZ95_03920 [Candidatus Omnitrophica bacterium]|nr:hypothetical protein [Candidatus Omnitrophota bacterium]